MNKIPENFDWKFYLEYYEDLRLAGLKTEEDAKRHYLTYGKFENRVYFKNEPKQNIIQENNFDGFVDICKNLIPFLPKDFPKINKNSNKKSLLIETRNLNHNEFIIKNTIQKLGDGWGHIIYCYQNNYQQIKSICDDISFEIEIRLLDNDLDVNSYNNLLLDLNFWEKINCEKVLIYQTDTFICKKFDESFLNYDYVGGYWGKNHSILIEKAYNLKEIQIGNGGFSLRSVNKIKEILKNKKPIPSKINYKNLKLIPEDLFFSSEFKKSYFKLPSIQTSVEFSSEYEFNPTSFGLHQPWKFFSGNQDLKFNLEKLFFLKNKKRIIFINHQESLTGAPRLLKDIINYELSIEEFDVFYLSLNIDDDIWDLPNKINYADLKGTLIEKVKYITSVFNPDIVFGNTFLSMNITSLFECKKVIFIHEYRSFIPTLINEEYKVLENFDKIFVACENTMKLLNERNINSELIPYYLNTNSINKLKFENTNREYIVGIGYAQLRKGIDRFLEIANQLPDEKFLWVGSTKGIEISDGYIQFEGQNFLLSDFKIGQKINIIKKKIKIPKNVKFIGLVQNEKINEEILPKTKCLLMLSTDDPFPLVVIESKILSTNVVSLKESGDSYKLCDSNDLVLETFDSQKIVFYIKNLKPNNFKINKSIQNVFNDNIVPFRKKYSELVNNKIKVFFSIDSESPNFSFELLKKSVLSVKKFPNYDIRVITNKIDERLLNFLKNEEIIEFNSSYESLIKSYYKNYPGVAGAYYRLEIPKICDDLNYDDKYVLYCDYDILWVKDIKNYLPRYKIKYFAVAQEFNKISKNNFNTGIMWMNVKNLLEKSEILYNYVVENVGNLKSHDQDVLNKIFENEIDILDNRLNWKPYWGIVNDFNILHFHWIKPNFNLIDDNIIKDIDPEIIDEKSIKYYQDKWIKS